MEVFVADEYDDRWPGLRTRAWLGGAVSRQIWFSNTFETAFISVTRVRD